MLFVEDVSVFLLTLNLPSPVFKMLQHVTQLNPESHSYTTDNGKVVPAHSI
jgi:hypothetical protein